MCAGSASIRAMSTPVCAISSSPPASSLPRSTSRPSVPGSETSTPSGKTSSGRSAGRFWRRRLGNWGNASGPGSPHYATAFGRLMRGQPRRWHPRSRITLRFIRATGLAFFCIVATRQLGAAEADCRDLEQNYAQTYVGITATQLNTLLFSSAAKDCGALARRLMAAGASLQARDRTGAMPLARAARGGHVALVEQFVAEGAPINARDLNGATALYAAAEAERPSTVAALLGRGADPNLTGRSSVSPLAAAAFRGNDRIVELLLARRADPDHADATGKAPIVYAAARGFASVVRRLLDAGVDAKAQYGNDLTALMWAAGHEDGVGTTAAVAVVELLIAHGAAVNAADTRGRTPVMIAAERGDAVAAETLMMHGADRDLRDKSGKSALDLAGNMAVREKLASHSDAFTALPDTQRAP